MYNEGLKMGGWGNKYEPVPKIYEFEKTEDEVTNEETPENVKQMILPFTKE